jgi:hypothetical protein
MVEVAVPRSGRDDQRIERDVVAARVDAAGLEIEADDLGEHDLAILLAPENPA